MAVADGLEVVTTQPDAFEETLGVNNKTQLAELERIHQRNIARGLTDAGVTVIDPARIDVRGTLTCGRDVEIDVNCIFEGKVELADGVRVGANCVIRNATIGAGTKIAPVLPHRRHHDGRRLCHRPLRPHPPRHRAGRGRAPGQLRRSEEQRDRQPLQGQSPGLRGRRRHRPARQCGRRHHHLQLRRRQQVPHHHRGRTCSSGPTPNSSPPCAWARGPPSAPAPRSRRMPRPANSRFPRAKQVSIPGWKRPVKVKKA